MLSPGYPAHAATVGQTSPADASSMSIPAAGRSTARLGRSLLSGLAIVAAVYLMDWGGIWLTREAGRVASIWLANAFVLSIVLATASARSRQALLLIGLACVANILANITAGDPPVVALALAACNTMEVMVAVWAITRFAPDLDLSRIRDQLIFTAVAVVAAPAVASILAGCALWSLAGADAVAVILTWFPADSLGMLILAPLLLSARGLKVGDELRAMAQLQALLPIALVAGVTFIVFSQTRYPLLFAIYPPLVLVAFVSGFFGATVSVVTVAAIAISLTMFGHGPTLFIQGDMQERIAFVQIFLGIAVALSFPVASIVAERRRLIVQLKTATLAAQAANMAKSNFLATMSHEIRTPLNSITGFTQIVLANDDLSVPVRRQLHLIEQASTALVTIVDDILDFSRIEAGGIRIASQPFALLQMLDTCISIVREVARQKGIEVRLDFSAELPRFVLGDEARVRQVLLNLLNNAVKFTEHGHVKLTVSIACSSNDAICFAIKDTGIGIPETFMPKLFERFSQLDSSDTRKFGGSGLGLAISQQLAGMMGGAITVDSRFGDGAKFTFTALLPKVTGAPETPRDSLAVAQYQGVSVLLVEDVALNQEIAVALLEPAGHRVDCVADGLSALAALDRFVYDIILMDIQMPGMDGVDTAKRIRGLPDKRSHTPIIALTANVLPDEVNRFRDAGIDAHVGKPYKKQQLLAEIERVLSGGGSGARMGMTGGPRAVPSQIPVC